VEFKGTKGEWKIRQNIPYDTGGWVVYSGRGKENTTIVRLTYGNIIPQPKDEGYLKNLANAKLIAAAKELLKACIKRAKWNKKYPSSRIFSGSAMRQMIDESDDIDKQIEEAIKKALE